MMAFSGNIKDAHILCLSCKENVMYKVLGKATITAAFLERLNVFVLCGYKGSARAYLMSFLEQYGHSGW
jgi:hypothetical protein